MSVLNYEPQSEEVNDCEELCEQNEIKFIYFNNTKIAEVLENNEHLLLELEDKRYLDKHPIKLINNKYREQIDFIFKKLKFINLEIDNLIRMTILELAKNSFEHGSQDCVQLRIVDGFIEIIDKGQKFNLLKYDKPPQNSGGGMFIIKELINRTTGKLKINYRYNESNIYKFEICNKQNIVFRFNKECSLKVDQSIKRDDIVKFSIPNI